MKKFIVLLLLMAIPLFAANTDRFYQGTVTVTETASKVVYKWVVTIVDSSDQYHSPPLFIGDCNYSMKASAIVSAASDINVYYNFGTGKIWWARVTASNLDTVSSSYKYDTQTVSLYSMSRANYVVLEIDGGGTAANTGEVVTIEASFLKNYFYTQGDDFRRIGRVVRQNVSGWVNP